MQILPYIIGAVIGAIATIVGAIISGYVAVIRERWALDRLLINKIHGYTESYYMKIAVSAGSFANEIKKLNGKEEEKEEKIRLSFYFFALYFSNQYKKYCSMTTYFLKDFIMENMLLFLEEKIKEDVEEYLNIKRKDISKLVKETNPDEMYIDFIGKLENNSLNLLFQNYKSKVINLEEKKIREISSCFNCYASLLALGVNLIYKPWYGKIPFYIKRSNYDFIEKSEEKFLRWIPQRNPQRNWKKFLKKLKKYTLKN